MDVNDPLADTEFVAALGVLQRTLLYIATSARTRTAVYLHRSAFLADALHNLPPITASRTRGEFHRGLAEIQRYTDTLRAGDIGWWDAVAPTFENRFADSNHDPVQLNSADTRLLHNSMLAIQRVLIGVRNDWFKVETPRLCSNEWHEELDGQSFENLEFWEGVCRAASRIPVSFVRGEHQSTVREVAREILGLSSVSAWAHYIVEPIENL